MHPQEKLKGPYMKSSLFEKIQEVQERHQPQFQIMTTRTGFLRQRWNRNQGLVAKVSRT